MKTKIALLAIFLAFIMTGCYNSNEENATLTLNLGGSSSSYSASALTNWPPTDAERSSLKYDVKLSKSSEEITATFSGSDLITFNVTPGGWVIEVTAYSDGELYASGVIGVTLRPGQNRVSILMHRDGKYELSIKILQSEIYLQQGGDHTFTIEPSFGLKNKDDFAKSSNPYKWTVSENKSNNTTINQSGYLKVGSDEPPNTKLTIRAAYINDESIYGTAIVTVSDLNDALPPSIQTHPQDKIYSVGETETLTVEAILLGSGTLSYQWYYNSIDSNSGGTKINGATDAEYILPIGTTDMFGITTYYYVEVTNTDSAAIGKKDAMTTSNVAAVDVTSQYIVTFNGNDASGTVPPVQFADNGAAIKLPNQGSLSQTGYTFAGWNTKIDGTGTNYSTGSSYTPTGSITMYAKWTPKPVEITLDNNGGNGSVTSISGKVYDETLGTALPENSSSNIPTRDGHTFMGWSTNSGTANTVNFDSNTVINEANGVDNADSSPTLTLYAVWSSTPIFTITFEAIIDQASSTIDTGLIISRSGSTKTGTIMVSGTVSGEFSSFKWYIDGTATTITTSSITLDAANNTYNGVGQHELTLEVVKGGFQYNKTITFTVTN